MANNRDNQVDLQKQEREIKSELIDADFKVKRLQERLQRLEKDNKVIAEEILQEKRAWQYGKEDVENRIKVLKTTFQDQQKQKTSIDTQMQLEIRRNKEINEYYQNFLQSKQESWEFEKSELIDKIRKLESKKANIDQFHEEHNELERQKAMLESDLKQHRIDKERELDEKNKEKTEATDKLKKDMLHKIQETKTSLLALKKEQLQTTIRLTVLQNHQLTTELEYQSKQTEKLLFKNSKLQEEIAALKRDVEIHKQVEQELARRSHFVQKLIKKLQTRVDELKQELEDIQQDKQIDKGTLDQLDDKQKEELIDKLEKQLEVEEKKLSKQQNEFEILKNENSYLQKKLENSEIKYTNLAILISECLAGEKQKLEQNNVNRIEEQFQDDKNEDQKSQINTYTMDLNEIKFKQVAEWQSEERISLLFILLNQIIPLIQSRNLVQSLMQQKTVNINILDEKISKEILSLPKINQENSSIGLEANNGDKKNGQRRFQDVPLDISTKIVKSNLREWGKPAQTVPSTNVKSLGRRFKGN